MHNNDMAVVVRGVRKTYGKGKIVALDDVSFDVGRGEVIGLLGPNGAGKTTMVDILSTLTRPDRGSATVAGYDVVAEPAGVRRSIMVTGQQVAVDDALSGEQNLVLFARLYGLSKSAARKRAAELLEQFSLAHAGKRAVSTYSGGMRRRIDIACGLVVQPQVAFLDEPTTGLDPRSRQAIWDLVASFKKLGIATLLTTQYLEEADALSDRIILIDHGKIIADGTANELKHRAGSTFCEIVPKDLKDLDAIVAALGSLLPEQSRAILTPESDRVTMPAPDGTRTLIEAARRIDEANIELADIALRRPSLDDVFLSMTADPSESLSHLASAAMR
ncbi:ATP-binding cassette domain-containing protein [Mycobacterium decipiens]|uniref:Daunorubicin/doxorubicin resistance ABC transporter ATP-binding protein DrrA n=1 Tax=Mycobacterium decipiens TaxID=1430326 RepID=A0A1X2LUE7_9MYCO|nr:ATP-binding cassette domain-containing protein [Mycobacterium decipiens]OSC40469.1 daunorubicin/doxorubicin resistance ABC transporter ATP-binding protein DrrA [Mycobacterium decipiens]